MYMTHLCIIMIIIPYVIDYELYILKLNNNTYIAFSELGFELSWETVHVFL